MEENTQTQETNDVVDAVKDVHKIQSDVNNTQKAVEAATEVADTAGDSEIEDTLIDDLPELLL
jgi:hypothetical protein